MPATAGGGHTGDTGHKVVTFFRRGVEKPGSRWYSEAPEPPRGIATAHAVQKAPGIESVHRRCVHLLIIALICAVPFVAGFSIFQPRTNRPLLGGGPPAASAAEPIAAPPVNRPGPDVNGSIAPPSAGPSAAPVRPETVWVQAFRATALWSSERADAARLTDLGQWTALRQIGAPIGTRVQVEYPGDGQTSLPLRGWINTPDIAPAGPPNPEYELASGGNVSPTSGVPVPRRIVQAWPQGISAQYAVMLDEGSGEILWGRNAHGRVPPASLTKIITALVALDRTRPADRVTVQVDSRSPMFYDSTLMGLKAGETLSMETLLYGLMLPSGNDAAVAIAQYVGGSEPGFVDLMNAKADQLGLTDSHFVNPHGLDADGHYSSPYDLSMFARTGMRDPLFQRLAGSRQYVAEGYTLNNLNRLLGMYPKADGIKVGYTDNAGRAIVASATQDGHRVYVALLRSNNPTPEAQALLEWAFRSFAWQ